MIMGNNLKGLGCRVQKSDKKCDIHACIQSTARGLGTRLASKSYLAATQRKLLFDRSGICLSPQ